MRACGHVDVGTCPHQVLAATLTLSQPGGGGQIMPTLYWCPHQVLKATGAPERNQVISVKGFTSHRKWAERIKMDSLTLFLFSLELKKMPCFTEKTVAKIIQMTDFSAILTNHRPKEKLRIHFFFFFLFLRM